MMPFPSRRSSRNRRMGWLLAGFLCVALVAASPPLLADTKRAEDEALHTSIFALYEANRRQGIPNYITIDLALAAYSLLRQNSIEQVERSTVLPALVQFLTQLDQALAGREAFWNTNERTDLAKAAHERNSHYIQLLLGLLNGSEIATLPASMQLEYDRILSADSTEESEYWGRAIDYTQYKPRGRYAGNTESERFFRTVRYAGSQFFAVLPSAATGVDEQDSALQIEQTLQLVSLITDNEQLIELRRKLEQVLSWAFGPTDDLTDRDVVTAVASLAPDTSTDLARQHLLAHAVQFQRQPGIADAIVDLSRLATSHSLKDVLTGWRLLPSRYSVQAAAQQSLLVSPTGTGSFTGEVDELPFGYGVVGGQAVKSFPTALEWMALLGSDTAWQQLKASQETAFENYQAVFDNNASLLEHLDGSELLHAQIIRAGMKAPTQRSAKDLSSLLAFQTWQQYLNVLYSKQSYTPGAKGLRLTNKRRRSAAVEVATDLYLMLGYAARKQLAQGGVAQWQEFSVAMDTLAELSIKAQNAIELSEEDSDYLNSLDSTLLKLTGGRDQPVVVDVHTEPNSATVVQHATGYPHVVEHVIRGDEMRGARFSFEQFKQPMRERLTVSEWQAKLAERENRQ